MKEKMNKSGPSAIEGNGLYYLHSEPIIDENGQKHNQISPVKCDLFTDDELFEIDISAQILKRLFKNLNRSTATGLEYKEFIYEADHIKSDNYDAIQLVDRRFRSFILEWNLYFEHWKTYINELNDSVFTDEFVDGYKKLYQKLMQEYYNNKDFIVAHVIRNYIAHANDVVQHAHINLSGNEYYISKESLEDFLNRSIKATHNNKAKRNIEKQLMIIKSFDKWISLRAIANNAMRIMRSCEKSLMDYQIEPQLLAACHYLNEAKRKIDEAGLGNEHFEILRSEPFYLDHGTFETITLISTEKDGSEIKSVVYRERINWQGYQAVSQYIDQIIESMNDTIAGNSDKGKEVNST